MKKKMPMPKKPKKPVAPKKPKKPKAAKKVFVIVLTRPVKQKPKADKKPVPVKKPVKAKAKKPLTPHQRELKRLRDARYRAKLRARAIASKPIVFKNCKVKVSK